MTHFDRFDICEAHYAFAVNYHSGGDTRREDFRRLHRMGFRPGAGGIGLESLSLNGLAIYGKLALADKQADQREDAAFARLTGKGN